jgi:hypothetical protein
MVKIKYWLQKLIEWQPGPRTINFMTQLLDRWEKFDAYQVRLFWKIFWFLLAGPAAAFLIYVFLKSCRIE